MRLERLETLLKADPTKVILQFFLMNEERTIRIIKRILLLSDVEVEKKLDEVLSEFSKRHKNLKNLLIENFGKVDKYIDDPSILSEKRKLLIGGYFSKEYSIESAALFNPSIVPHPDQVGIDNGDLKFVLSLRATGEGHISSIEFREGIISSGGEVKFINDSEYRILPKKLSYTWEEIEKKGSSNESTQNSDQKRLLDVNYKSHFDPSSKLSERVLFPNSPTETMGLEDARFVKFTDENITTYYATYTAYNGRDISSQIIETKDFINFETGLLYGKSVKDKGMAIFPRKIRGKYYITSRQDGESLFLMESDDLYNWNNAEKILAPEESWGIIQLGNCGSPIETEAGWLLITHAVGPFRKYVISAILLDLDNPYKVIGKLNEPLIEPNEQEREGYVPNVVYSCGSIVHKNNLIIPYAMSDAACGFAKVNLKELLKKIL
ncbi:MAG: glycoside hydrolase family 130 protein [Melioribacteraceae bacterium]|nr:glycoside hydrolase family 130 protein [Melioribacteraceae bacterium]MCF8264474.1 glycoside hydrolase family 130 protein [Melioribacteraceae bacterium]